MKIIVHYPTTADKIDELEKSVADIHAQAVARYMENLSCPKKQKIKIVDQLLSEINLNQK